MSSVVHLLKIRVKMNKLIIDNRTELTDFEAVVLVSRIIKRGRISNNGKQYCLGTGITIEDREYMVWTDLNKKSDRFVITIR
jgi:hypothetical protein